MKVIAKVLFLEKCLRANIRLFLEAREKGKCFEDWNSKQRNIEQGRWLPTSCDLSGLYVT